MKRFIFSFIALCCLMFAGWNWQPADEITNTPFIFDVCRGAVPGVTYERKFGAIDTTTADVITDVWKYGAVAGEYTWSDTADIDRVSSDSASDVTSVLIKGLDGDGYEVIQTATLTGTTPVALTTPLWRVNRVENNNGTNYIGNIYVFVNGATTGGVPDDADSVRGYIAIGDNQTLQTIYTVPKGKVAYILGSEVSITKGLPTATAVTYKAKIRTYGGVFKVKYTYSLSSTGTSRSVHNAPLWLPIPELSDFKPEVITTASGTGVTYAFSVLLVNN